MAPPLILWEETQSLFLPGGPALRLIEVGAGHTNTQTHTHTRVHEHTTAR